MGLELIDDSGIRRASTEDEKDKIDRRRLFPLPKKGAWQLGDKKEYNSAGVRLKAGIQETKLGH